ncbi:MAG: glutathione S-transferase [Hyphomicrobiaceae bacterium]|nr:glutathione S-transferase [Hyphomicrobiaceae bacterium]
MLKLIGRPGWGSVMVEAQLAWYGLDYTVEDVDDLFKSAEARAGLQPVNPLAQIPTLVLPDGAVMTESAAITLHLADVAASSALVPAPGEHERPRFLRWLIFIVANIYPTFTFADDPARFVPGEEAQKGFRANVDDYGRRLWSIVEGEAGQPWFLGGRLSALDVYICAMTRWRPRSQWFAANAPRLAAIAAAADALPQLQSVWNRNFPAS